MRVLAVVGTRPEAVKLAPVIRLLRSSTDTRCEVVALGQHRELLSDALASLEVEPDMVCELMDDRQALADVTRRVLEILPPILGSADPAMVLVAGDTNTAMAAALAAFYQRIPVGHVEAGLRTGRRDVPFPEEANRALIAQLASLHFAPTEGNRKNLLREGVAAEGILVTGNPVIDALEWAIAQLWTAPDGLRWLLDDPRPILLATAHRRESWGPPLRSIARALADIAVAEPDWHVVCCLHPNPEVREALEFGPGVTRIEPLPYLDFVRVLGRASLVITDSGGLQEEAPALRVPVLVARDATERVEAVAAGSAVLTGTHTEGIVAEARRLMGDTRARRRMAASGYRYGDGNAAERIVDGVREFVDACGRGRFPDGTGGGVSNSSTSTDGRRPGRAWTRIER